MSYWDFNGGIEGLTDCSGSYLGFNRSQYELLVFQNTVVVVIGGLKDCSGYDGDFKRL